MKFALPKYLFEKNVKKFKIVVTKVLWHSPKKTQTTLSKETQYTSITLYSYILTRDLIDYYNTALNYEIPCRITSAKMGTHLYQKRIINILYIYNIWLKFNYKLIYLFIFFQVLFFLHITTIIIWNFLEYQSLA